MSDEQKPFSNANPEKPENPGKVNVFDQAIQPVDKKKLSRETRDGFFNYLSRLGLNNDNALSDSTYNFNLITRNRVLLEAAYRGSWVTGAVIDSPAEDMTRAGIDIVTSDKVDLSRLEKAMTRLQIWDSMQTGIKWGDLYGGAIGVMQIEGQDLASPLNLDTISQGQFKGIAIYDRWMLNPVLSPPIPFGPDIGLPQMYQIVSSALQSLGGPNDPTRELPGQEWRYTGIQNVHYTRVIRFPGILLPFYQAITEMMWGESRLERLWDRLIAFDNASLSAAQLVDRANLRTVKVEGLRDIISVGGEAMAGLRAMFDEMRLLQVNEGLTLVDKEDDVETTSYTFSGLSDVLLQLGQQLSGASGIPMRRLFSQVPAGLNDSGDADIRLYYDKIKARQEADLRRPVDILLKVLWRSVYGKPSPDDLEFDFVPLWQMSAMDKAVIGKTKTETVLAGYESGLVPAFTAMQELKDMGGDTGLFSNIQDEDIKSAELEPPPMPGEPEESSPDGEQAPGEKGSGPVKNFDSFPNWERAWRWFRKETEK